MSTDNVMDSFPPSVKNNSSLPNLSADTILLSDAMEMYTKSSNTSIPVNWFVVTLYSSSLDCPFLSALSVTPSDLHQYTLCPTTSKVRPVRLGTSDTTVVRPLAVTTPPDTPTLAVMMEAEFSGPSIQNINPSAPLVTKCLAELSPLSSTVAPEEGEERSSASMEF
jgi:hypothetical protein